MGVRGWRGIGVMHPEPPFLLLPLPSGLDEEDEAPSSAPGHGDQIPVLSLLGQTEPVYEAKAGSRGNRSKEKGGNRERRYCNPFS